MPKKNANYTIPLWDLFFLLKGILLHYSHVWSARQIFSENTNSYFCFRITYILHNINLQHKKSRLATRLIYFFLT